MLAVLFLALDGSDRWLRRGSLHDCFYCFVLFCSLWPTAFAWPGALRMDGERGYLIIFFPIFESKAEQNADADEYMMRFPSKQLNESRLSLYLNLLDFFDP